MNVACDSPPSPVVYGPGTSSGSWPRASPAPCARPARVSDRARTRRCFSALRREAPGPTVCAGHTVHGPTEAAALAVPTTHLSPLAPGAPVHSPLTLVSRPKAGKHGGLRRVTREGPWHPGDHPDPPQEGRGATSSRRGRTAPRRTGSVTGGAGWGVFHWGATTRTS